MLSKLLQCCINIVLDVRIVVVVVMYYDILTDLFDNPMIIVCQVCIRRQGCSIGTHGVLTKVLSCTFKITRI